MNAGRLAHASRLALAIWILALSASGAAAQAPAPGVLAVTGATLIDGTGSVPIPNATVVVTDGRITAAGPAANVDVPEGARVIDAAGRWLVPGFVDAHAHVTLGPIEIGVVDGVPQISLLADPDVPIRSLRTLMAHGITAIRDPGGDPAKAVALRDAVAAGALVGPRMQVAGMVIDGTPFEGLVNQVHTEEEIRAAVRADAQAGVDLIKLYVTLSPEMMGAAIAEAQAQGVETVAHLQETSWTEAAELGLDHIVHIIPGSPELLPADRRDAYAALQARGTQSMAGWFDLVDLQGPEIREMIDALVHNDVSVDPTLVIFEAMVRGDDPYYTQNEALALAAPSLLENWRAFFTFNVGWTPEDFTAGRAAWPKFLELTRMLHEAGVTITAGTDANNPWVVPGHSFHRELELLVDAGIPENEVLRIATYNGAKVAGMLDDTGTVEVGKWADLVLLGADPLADISNTRSIEWTMQAGRLYTPAQLLAGIR